MDARLYGLINEYVNRVSEAVELMKFSGIALPKSNNEWAANGIPQKGQLNGGVKYFKHGYGCAVHLNSGAVDFDFGENGEFNGFDYWRLKGFSDNNLNQYGFNSPDELKECFEAEISNGNLLFSGYILYYLKDKI
ncbi:DUF6896 domain-containing protein [Proteus mirabilis]|nr:hypothetical protein [Proteus mirabilis]